MNLIKSQKALNAIIYERAKSCKGDIFESYCYAVEWSNVRSNLHRLGFNARLLPNQTPSKLVYFTARRRDVK